MVQFFGDERLQDFGNGFPDWLTAGKPVPADAPRKTFAAFGSVKKNDALLPSGLMGPSPCTP